MAKKWYIVHTYSGFENKVRESLTERVRSHGLDDYFGQILVPMEKVVEMVKGQRRESSRKFYPGYIVVEMEMNDETWHLVKDTAKVTGFVGGSETDPTPISDEEAQRILSQMQEGTKAPRPKFNFEEGDEVRVIDGPFNNFNGSVEEVNPEKGKLRVLISIFGRATPVELEFVQVTKV
ncbi:NusG antitermination factor [Desulfarculus baarsii DSM 2075]|uniref:Transcription termination/antitermination protein NusG n=1 Tax=Desulfarculus baarsii (strain ATCC 33931 / DSM 2075 / LMG 7858 / VKM B-1802 / 2st14) TaxID=644282 RepID=E1QKU4_DESB2|nr:transcription termination/antitermination protein NusG [Desulfarculus baarsii]ADK86303.1 NusG antitermination factor [Desulfarculus baarsii DSM 2075]